MLHRRFGRAVRCHSVLGPRQTGLSSGHGREVHGNGGRRWDGCGDIRNGVGGTRCANVNDGLNRSMVHLRTQHDHGDIDRGPIYDCDAMEERKDIVCSNGINGAGLYHGKHAGCSRQKRRVKLQASCAWYRDDERDQDHCKSETENIHIMPRTRRKLRSLRRKLSVSALRWTNHSMPAGHQTVVGQDQ